MAGRLDNAWCVGARSRAGERGQGGDRQIVWGLVSYGRLWWELEGVPGLSRLHLSPRSQLSVAANDPAASQQCLGATVGTLRQSVGAWPCGPN